MIKLQLEHNVLFAVIVNVGSWSTIGASIIEHVADQVRKRLISQLINGNFKSSPKIT